MIIKLVSNKYLKDWYQLYFLVFFISLLFSLIFAVGVGYQNVISNNKEKSRQVNDIKQIGHIIERHLWLYDFKAINVISSLLLQRRFIQSVVVVDTNKLVLFDDHVRINPDSQTVNYKYKLVSKKGEHIGYLKTKIFTVSDNHPLKQAIYDGVIVFLIILIFSSFLTFFYTTYFIAKPLEQLSKAIDLTVASGEPVKTDMPNSTRFGRFAHQFNLMQTKLEAEQQRLANSLVQNQKQTRIAEDQLILLDSVMRGVGQSVCYFNDKYDLVNSAIGDEEFSIFKSIPLAPYLSIQEVVTVIEEYQYPFRIIGDRRNNSNSNILYETEVTLPQNSILNIKAIDLGSSGLAIVSTDITRAKNLEVSLRQAQKLEAIGLLTSGVAHDLNNYLTITMNTFEILGLKFSQKNSVDGEFREMVSLGNEVTQRASKVVHSLLAFSRTKPIENTVLSPETIINNLNPIISTSLGANIIYEASISTNMKVFADEDMLHTSLLNLIFNARDAIGKEGRITLDVKKLSQEKLKKAQLNPKKNYVSFEISDTGKGVPIHLIEKIMDPFFTTKEIGEGTGLGLSMVYGFAKQMDGALFFENNPAGGATFNLVLPENSVIGAA